MNTRSRESRYRIRAGLWLAIASLFFAATGMAAQDSPAGVAKKPGVSLPNLVGPTFGGKQFWSDQLVYHDWRIQRNVLTGHSRLLDEKNVRRAWGTFAHCQQRLEAFKQQKQLPPLKPNVILLLHGLVRSRKSMDGLCQYLRRHSDDTVLNVSYASSRGTLSEHADSVAGVIRNLDGVQQVSLVAHSLGNLVIRHYLADRERAGRQEPTAPRVHRIVMLAPPNNGAALAEQFRENQLFRTIWGTSGLELAEKWPTLEKQLATPQCQFGIIAGGTGRDTGRNPLLRGDDDLVVSVAETRLPGAHDFVVVTALHSLIMDNAKVQEYSLRFLQRGCFIAEDKRCPIPRN